MFLETHRASPAPVWAALGQTCVPASFPQHPPADPSDCSCCPQLSPPVWYKNTTYSEEHDDIVDLNLDPSCMLTSDSVFRSTDCPSSDCTSVFTGLCSFVGGWPGSESGSWMKKSSSTLLRLHLCSRSGSTSGSGKGGGLQVASGFFISISSGSCFTEDKVTINFMMLQRKLNKFWVQRRYKHLPSAAGSIGSQSSSFFSFLIEASLNSSLNPHPDTARGSWTGQLLFSLRRKGSSTN